MISLSFKALSLLGNNLSRISHRTRKPWLRRYVQDLWERRQLVGPEDPKPRCQQPNWNYETELYAFGHRVGEQFSESNLRRAFLHRSYVEIEEQERFRLLSSADNAKSSSAIIGVEDNEDLSKHGSTLMSEYVKAYLRYHLPKYPEEGIIAAHDYLTSANKLVTLTRQLGAYDLILAGKFPYDDNVVAGTFHALVGALALDKGKEAAGIFVQDFVLTQLVDLDINELWYFKYPWEILCSFLEAEGLQPPEPRIIRQAGVNTVTPIYVVGIYSDKKLIASSAGESEEIAKEMASRESLKCLWQSDSTQFVFGKKGRMLDLHPYFGRPNWSIADRLGIEVQLDSSLYDEPLTAQQLAVNYKQNIETVMGTPYRRRLRHRFYPGTPARKTPRRMIAPKAKTI